MSISASTKIGEGPLSEQTGVTTHETGKNPSAASLHKAIVSQDTHDITNYTTIVTTCSLRTTSRIYL